MAVSLILPGCRSQLATKRTVGMQRAKMTRMVMAKVVSKISTFVIVSTKIVKNFLLFRYGFVNYI